jgi:ubiquinol-cytochrome c reductase cytochrome b subunit
VGRATDERLGVMGGVKWAMRYVFPDHWSFLLGEIALYSFIVLVASGIYLTLYYVPSDSQVIYHGSYPLLQGEQMSEAYRSVLDLSTTVPAGLLFR